MGGSGVINTFSCFVHTRGIGYTKYLGDGDSKSYQSVVVGKLYDPNIAVTKLEYTGHVQKRTGTRLWMSGFLTVEPEEGRSFFRNIVFLVL
jgi:hypothetical protein